MSTEQREEPMADQPQLQANRDAILTVDEKQFYGLYIGSRLPSGTSVITDTRCMPKSARILYKNIIQFEKFNNKIKGLYNLVKFGGAPLAEDMGDVTFVHSDSRMYNDSENQYKLYIRNLICKKIFVPYHHYVLDKDNIRRRLTYENLNFNFFGSDTLHAPIRIIMAPSCSGKSHFINVTNNVFLDGDSYIKWPSDPEWINSEASRNEVNIGLWQQIAKKWNNNYIYLYNGNPYLIPENLKKRIEILSIVLIPLDKHKENIASRSTNDNVYDIDWPYVKKKLASGDVKELYNRSDLKRGKQYLRVTMDNVIDVGVFVESYRNGSGDGMETFFKFYKDGKYDTYKEETFGFTDGRGMALYMNSEDIAVMNKRRNPDFNTIMDNRRMLYKYAKENDIPILYSFNSAISREMTKAYHILRMNNKSFDGACIDTGDIPKSIINHIQFIGQGKLLRPKRFNGKLTFGTHISFRIHTNEYARYSGLTQHRWKHLTRFLPQLYIMGILGFHTEYDLTPCKNIHKLWFKGNEISPSGHMLGAFTWLAFPDSRLSGMPNIYPDFITYLTMYMVNQSKVTPSLEPSSDVVAYHRFVETLAGIIGSYYAIKILLRSGLTIKKRDYIMWKLHARRAIRMIKITPRTWYFGVKFDRDADTRFGPII